MSRRFKLGSVLVSRAATPPLVVIADVVRLWPWWKFQKLFYVVGPEEDAMDGEYQSAQQLREAGYTVLYRISHGY